MDADDMMVLAVVAAICVASWSLVSPPALARLDIAPPRQLGTTRRRGTVASSGAAALGCVALGFVVDGFRGGALGAVLGMVVVTVGVLWRRQRARNLQRGRRRDVVAAAEVMAGLLHAGRVPATALQEAGEEAPVLAPVAAVARAGGDVPTALRRAAEEPGHEGLAHLADAWYLAARSGAPQARAWEQAAESLAADEDVARLVATEVTAARAGGRVMSFLPVAGIGLGYLMGGDPVSFLLSSPPGWILLVGAALLAGAGVLWIDAVADRAGRS